MTRAAYTGHETLTFPDYLDQETGRTLTAEPGQSYDVVPASGHPVPDLPAGWFTVLEGDEGVPGEPEGVTPEPGAEHDGGEPQQS